ncbi:hypothetical protein [Capnocytophaga sputigena]|uniref:hypothetical protein n=1 Tax=Capnocytophaga sputigena TaxID=1019 RepID=UPI003C71ABFD
MSEENKKGKTITNKVVTLGADFYTTLKRNNIAVLGVCAVAIVVIIGSFMLVASIASNYQQNVYAVDSKGDVIPLRLLHKEEDREIEIKANLDRFVDLYFDLDGFTIKKKLEKLLWVLDTKPSNTVKQQMNSGYFNDFTNIAGLQQKAYILGNTIRVTKKEPYRATFRVRLQRINGDAVNYYNADVDCEMIEVSRNYPLNPYGLLITDFNVIIKKIEDINEEEYTKEDEENDKMLNQNIIEDGRAN